MYVNEMLEVVDKQYLLYQSLHIKSDTALAALHIINAYTLPSATLANADIFPNKIPQYYVQAYFENSYLAIEECIFISIMSYPRHQNEQNMNKTCTAVR